MLKISFFLVLFSTLAFGCCHTRNANKTTPAAESSAKSLVQVTGKVTAIKNGKDGYTATVVTNENVEYDATISIPNMTDPANFRRVAVGETITVSGELWNIQNANQLTVRKM
jgi:hypothetical protein